MKRESANQQAYDCMARFARAADAAVRGLARARRQGILLAGALGALAGMAPAAAASPPQWGTCKRVTVAITAAARRFSDPGCTVRTNARAGAYEWEALGAGRVVALAHPTLEGAVRFQTRAGRTIECSALGPESMAQPDGAKRALTPLWELQGCESGGVECHTTTSFALGEINNFYQWFEEPAEPLQSKPGWSGRLGWISRSGGRVGIEYLANNHEPLFDPISCGGALGMLRIGGDGHKRTSIVATVTPVDVMTGEIEETYAEAEPGVPLPAGLQHRPHAGATAFLEGHWEPIAISAVFRYRVDSGPGTIEIRALG